jgi:hypothetical protein
MHGRGLTSERSWPESIRGRMLGWGSSCKNFVVASLVEPPSTSELRLFAVPAIPLPMYLLYVCHTNFAPSAVTSS